MRGVTYLINGGEPFVSLLSRNRRVKALGTTVYTSVNVFNPYYQINGARRGQT